MTTAYLTVGAPASGKSTWARHAAVGLNAAIVCRDDIRIMQGLKHGQDEELVTKVSQALMEGLIAEGKDFIVADTNINQKFRKKLIKFLHQHGCDVELVVFDADLDTLILRDSTRDAKVGADVIVRMYNDLKGQTITLEETFLPAPSYAKYEHHPRRRDAIVCDIDGTLARHHNRSPFDESKVFDDKPIPDVIGVLTSLAQDYYPIFVSGRTDGCRKDTEDWLLVHTGIDVKNADEGVLHMRKSGDQRPDYVIKNEIYDENIIPFFNVVMALDDRDQVVHHVRARGITVAQVAPGRF